MALFSSSRSYIGLGRFAFRHLQVAESTTATFSRAISLSAQRSVKEIIVTKEGNTTIVEGQLKESPWKNDVVKVDRSPGDVCPLCILDLPLRNTDVLILSQFVRSDGVVLPASVTGLCRRQQNRIEQLVSEAQEAGLLVNMQGTSEYKDPRKRPKWKKWNTYYLTEEEQRWKDIDEKESHYYEKPKKKKILSLMDVL